MKIIDIDKWQEIFESMKKNKLRTFLTSFSVGWGICILVVLLGAGKGLENGIKQQFNSSASNTIWIWSGETSIPYQGYKAGRPISLNTDDYNHFNNDYPQLDNVAARNHIWSNSVISYKTKYELFTIRATYPEYGNIEKVKVVDGRFLNEIDVKDKRKIAILSTDVKKALFEDEDAIGKFIKINNISFRVVGIYIDDDNRRRNNRVVYIPLPTAQKLISGSDHVQTLAVTTGDANPSENIEIEQRIRADLAFRHKFAIEDQKALGIWNSLQELTQIMNILSGVKIFVWFIGILTILAGIIGVGNIMVILVKERTKEIGIRKALGATPFSIVSMVLMEAIFITSIAGYFGMVVGIALLEYVPKKLPPNDFFLNPYININIAIIAIIILVVSGSLAGLIPAIRASKIKPIIALRDE